jgi:hypothetical protein
MGRFQVDNVSIVFLVNGQASSAIEMDVPKGAGTRVAYEMDQMLVDVFSRSGAVQVEAPQVAPL